MAVCTVWAWPAGQYPDGTPILDRILAQDGQRPASVPDTAWLAEQDAEAWWDEIHQTGKGRRWLKPLADLIGDGRQPEWKVSARQLRQALRRVGLRDTVESAIQSQGGELLDWWEYSIEINRYHPLVAQMCAQLNLSDAQVDDIWALAESFA